MVADRLVRRQNVDGIPRFYFFKRVAERRQGRVFAAGVVFLARVLVDINVGGINCCGAKQCNRKSFDLSGAFLSMPPLSG